MSAKTIYEAARERVAAYLAARESSTMLGEVVDGIEDGGMPVLLLAGDLRLLSWGPLGDPLHRGLEELIQTPDGELEWPDFDGEPADDEEETLPTVSIPVVAVERLVALLDDPYPSRPYTDRMQLPAAPSSWPEHAYPTTEQFLDWVLELDRPDQLRVMEHVLAGNRESHRCFIQNHAARLEMADRDNRWLRRQLEAVADAAAIKPAVAP